MSPTLRPQAAETRAKVNTMTPIRARSRSPTTVSVSMERSSSPASSAVRTGVLPLPSFWRGAFTESAGLCSSRPSDQAVEEHADCGHVLLEGGGPKAIGFGRVERVAPVERADILHALFAAALQERKERTQRPSVGSARVVVVGRRARSARYGRGPYGLSLR